MDESSLRTTALLWKCTAAAPSDYWSISDRLLLTAPPAASQKKDATNNNNNNNNNDDCVDDNQTNREKATLTHDKCYRLDYHQVFWWISRLCLKLRQQVVRMIMMHTENDCHSENHHHQVAVAVAIPQGPLLPLMVGAVHAANRYYHFWYDGNADSNHLDVSTKATVSAVLVPWDLRHAIHIRPTVILVAADCDVERARSWYETARETKGVDHHQQQQQAQTQQQQTHNASSGSSPSCLWQPRHRPAIVDVREWIVALSDHSNDSFLSNNKTIKPRRHNESLLDALDAYEGVSSSLLCEQPRLSHIVYTSGTSSGRPKGCCSSLAALQHYCRAKNQVHQIYSGTSNSGASNTNNNTNAVVYLASPLAFDPCLSDILATWTARATLVVGTTTMVDANYLQDCGVTHLLTTPSTFQSTIMTKTATTAPASLRVVALGGERIPARLVQQFGTWTRHAKLYATYGVTEACVYQTMGEIDTTTTSRHGGQDVGRPFPGLDVHIAKETTTDEWQAVPVGEIGEIVLSGLQVDALSGYYNLHDPSEQTNRPKFVCRDGVYYYRTGDRGYLLDHRLFVLGRIAGEEGMVKFHGVRVETSEIETAFLDQSTVVQDCRVVAIKPVPDSSVADQLIAYVILTPACRRECRSLTSARAVGFLLTPPGPLWTLLDEQCRRHARVSPTSMVVYCGDGGDDIQFPVSSTGKRTSRGLPALADCVVPVAPLLQDYAPPVGATVARHVVECLNLQQQSQQLLTVSATFGSLGGDSLAATRVVRALYAEHHQVANTRFLGGRFGSLGDGAFSVVHLLRAPSLGAYVDFLQRHGVCGSSGDVAVSPPDEPAHLVPVQYQALQTAISHDQVALAEALLNLGTIDPNYGQVAGRRLGTVSGRHTRRQTFSSTLLHLACQRGQLRITQLLVQAGAALVRPDASGLYPIHLAACTQTQMHSVVTAVGGDAASEQDRLQIIQLLIEAGVAWTIKDGNKQSLLHAAARAGHCLILRYILNEWRVRLGTNKFETCLEWRDCWARTAVHWAVLNGHVNAVAVLLDHGCRSCPDQPRVKTKTTSAALETPQEMNERVNGSSAVGEEIGRLLNQYNRAR